MGSKSNVISGNTTATTVDAVISHQNYNSSSRSQCSSPSPQQQQQHQKVINARKRVNASTIDIPRNPFEAEYAPKDDVILDLMVTVGLLINL